MEPQTHHHGEAQPSRDNVCDVGVRPGGVDAALLIKHVFDTLVSVQDDDPPRPQDERVNGTVESRQ